jgi:hypothetical protein
MLKPMPAISAAGGKGSFGTTATLSAQPAARARDKNPTLNHGFESAAPFTFILEKQGCFSVLELTSSQKDVKVYI